MLAEGWKTYWRMPGDAGVPPVFDWAGSTNVASVKVLYPAPSRMKEPAAETDRLQGLRAVSGRGDAAGPEKPVELKLLLEFGICREICIPGERRSAWRFRHRALAGAPPSAILAALSACRGRRRRRRKGDPELKSIAGDLDGPAPRLAFEARFAGGAKDGDLFIEAPEGIYVPLPQAPSPMQPMARPASRST